MNDHQALQLIEAMVATPSVSGDEAALAQLLVEQMHHAGFDAHIDAVGNAVGMLGDAAETVVLLGHMDTVPGQIPVVMRDGELWGRGSVDAKGSLATFIAAAARAHAEQRLAYRVIVVGCVEEEIASSKGAHFVAQTMAAPTWCIVGEPSGADRLTLGYKGNLRAQIRIEQDAAHSAHASQTAAEHGCELWQSIALHANEFNQGRERAFDQLLPSLVRIESGGDGLRDWCELLVNARLPLDLDPAAYTALLQQLLPNYAHLNISGATPAYSSERTSSIARRFGRVFRANGQQPRYVQKTGTADMNVVGPAWGCPVVAYGPGDAALDHTPHERLPLAEYLQAINVLTAVLSNE